MTPMEPRFSRFTVPGRNHQIRRLLPLLIILTACGKNAANYLERGDEFFAQGKYQDALLNYRNAIQKEPNQAEAHYKIGLTELKFNNKKGMIAYWQRALNLAPQKDSWRISLSDQLFDILLRDPRRPKAISDELVSNYEFLIKKNGASFHGQRLKGQLALLENRIPDAVEAYETALRAKPGNDSAAMGLAQAKLRSLDQQQVVQGEKSLLEWIDRDPGNASLYEALYLHYAATGREKLGEGLLRTKLEKNPDNLNTYSQLADYLVTKQRVDEADGIISKMTGLGQRQPRAYALAGEYFGRQRRIEESRKQFEIAIQLLPAQRQEVQNRLGLILIAGGDTAKAFDYLSQLLKAEPSNGEARAMRATLALDTGKPDSAIADAKKLIKTDPNNPQFIYLVGRALAANGDNAGAKSYFSRVVQKNPDHIASLLELAKLALIGGAPNDSIRICSEIVEKSPNQTAALLIRAEAYARNGEIDKARADLRSVLRLEPNSADAKIQLARTDALSNRSEEAEKVLAAYYRLGQLNLKPLEGLVLAATIQGKTEKAVALLEREIKLRPEHPKIAAMYAEAQLRKGNVPLALRAIQTALAKNRTHPELLLAYSRALSESNSYFESEKIARELLARGDIPQTVGNARLAEVLQLQGKNMEAIALYRSLLKQEGENSVFLNNLAFLIAEEKQDLAQARQLAGKALNLSPGNSQILDTLALIEIQSGRYAEALAILTRISDKEPNDAGIQLHLGLAKLKLGQTKGAREAFDHALKSNPTVHQSAQVQEAIKRL